jgi:hypothetical protein
MINAVCSLMIVTVVLWCLGGPAHGSELAESENQALPRVLFMIAEQNIGQELAIFWWSWWGQGGSQFAGQTVDMAVSESTLKEAFLAQDFNVVDISSSSGKFEISNSYRIADLTNDGARVFGKKLAADIVITGKALAKEGPRTPGSSVGSYLADITVNAIRVDTGQVLSSARGQGVARHIVQHTGGNEALARAAQSVADKLITQITSKWPAATTQNPAKTSNQTVPSPR